MTSACPVFDTLCDVVLVLNVIPLVLIVVFTVAFPTITAPVPFGVSDRLPLVLVVLMVLPSSCMLSTLAMVRLPTLVMLGCAAVVTVPAVPAVATFRLATCVVDVTTNGAVPDAKVEVSCPLVVKEVNVPTEVMFGCAAVVTVPDRATLRLFTLVVEVITKGAVPVARVEVSCPLVVSEVSVPRLVMFGCAAVVTVPAVPAVATFRLATCVVELTTSGAVPVVIVLLSWPVATTLPVRFRFAEANVRLELAPSTPLSLKTTCVFDPGAAPTPVVAPSSTHCELVPSA